jgi:hypothetical protein
MTPVYHIITIRVNETSWAHVWKLRFRYLGTGYDNDEGNSVTPLAPVPTAVLKEIVEEEAPVENGPQELDALDDLDDLNDDPNEGCSDMDEWFPQDGSNDRD